MSRFFHHCVLTAAISAITALAATPAAAEDPTESAVSAIAIALTDEEIAIDTGFTGAQLTLFGAITGVENRETLDIISVIRGPDTSFRLRRFEQRNLIWMPGEARIIDNAPGLFITSATRTIGDIAPLPDQAALRLTPDHLKINIEARAADAPVPHVDVAETSESFLNADLYKNAFLTEIEELGLYQTFVGGVSFKKGALFTINIELPANTPVGQYDVAVFLYRDGVNLGMDTAKLSVNKVGLERQIFELAHERPITYGLLCVAMSLFAGWIASLAFRK